MKKNIITISREFGSGGRYIGEEVAKRLGYEFYDKAVIAKTAEKTGLSPEYIAQTGEYSPKKSKMAYAFVGRDETGASVEDYIFAAQRDIIFEAVEKGPCVIVGRCADYILRHRADCMNVFILGNLDDKVRRIMELYRLSEEEARKKMREVDKKRSIHYRYYAEREWGDSRNYTMTLNSSVIGYEKCIDFICKTAE